MARLTAFRFHAGDSFLHRHDVRHKMGEVLLLSIAFSGGGLIGMTAANALLLTILVHVRVSIRDMLYSLRWMAFFFLAVFAARALSTPGMPLWAWAGLVMTREGVYSGAIAVWRLGGIVLLSLLFIASTRPAEIKAAVQWLLKPVPFLPERRVGVMMSLMIRFIPVLLSQAAETRDAVAARGLSGRNHPFRSLRFSTLPVIRRTLLSADRLALAMAARCYSEDRTDPGFQARPVDHVCLSLTLLACCILGGLSQ
ncbi:MAG: energy-coupling factor transporter transmembrane component T family protein [Desulfobacterales bacterium]|jgi:energy-coupling factor transporter transmembrane protein EcfT